MELSKVKAVGKTSARNSNNRKSEKRKQWSVRFIERLLLEYEADEHERTQEKEEYRREGFLGAAGEYEDSDRRIVIKGEEDVPIDWDSFEMTVDWTEPVLTSELYEDIIDNVKNVGNWKADILYKIANAVMQDYYEGKFDESAVGELFYECYVKCIEKKRSVMVSREKHHKVLGTLYEYFSRVNARKSVAANEREGRTLIEKCGLSWAGTTYYNSDFYYIYEKVQKKLCDICHEISERESFADIVFEDMERQTQFLHAGGLSFHSVFVWIQQKDNHPGKQYGMKELKKVPPHKFRYLYRNHFAGQEENGVRILERQMKMQAEDTKLLWRSFTLRDGREYHNGMSYLLEGSIMEDEDEAVYGATMTFLQNFILYRLSGCVEFLLVQGKK